MRNVKLKQKYIARINKVIDYIEDRLTEPLSLEQIGEISEFSPYHFHRIFKAIIGETLNSFIQRLRIEKAASLLTAHPKKSITKIAFDCGIPSSAAFSRLFKSYYQVSPSQWRQGAYADTARFVKAKTRIGKPCTRNGKICRFLQSTLAPVTKLTGG